MVNGAGPVVILLVVASALLGVQCALMSKRMRKQAQTLAATRREADAAAREMERLLSDTRHDLRTPVSAIIGYSEMLREDAEAGSDYDRAVDLGRIEQAGRQLLEIVDKLRPGANARRCEVSR